MRYPLNSFADKLRSDAYRRQGVALVVDAALDRPFREVVDVPALVDLLVAAVTQATVQDTIERHAAPGLQRLSALEGRVGDWVPEASRDDVEALLAATRVPPFAWAKEVVEPELFGQLLAPVLSEWLMQFVGRMPGVGGLAGAFAKRMRKRSSPEESSNPVGDRLRKLTVEFSKSTLGSLREAFRARIRSDEGRAIIAKIRTQAFRNTMDVPLQGWIVELKDLPWDRVAELAPAFAESFVRSDAFKSLARSEITAFVDAETTLGAFAERLGVLPDVRAYLRVQGEAVLEGLLENPDFLAWIDAPAPE